MPYAADLVVLGAAQYDQGNYEGAYSHYAAALQMDPNLTVAYANLGVVFSALNQLEASEACLRRVTALCPYDGNQFNNLGNILMRRYKYLEAMGSFATASQLCPENPVTWHNMALCASRLGHYDEALEWYARAMDLGQNSAGIQNDLAMTLLYKGTDLAHALRVYEARWETMPHSEAWDFHIPEWQGESLVGRNILVHAEQGYGDTIMTARFIDDLLRRGAVITLGVFKGMLRLFDDQGWDIGVCELSSLDSESAEFFDFHSPMFSMMRHLGIEQDKICGAPYMVAPKIITPALPKDRFNVGICWASGTRGGEADWRKRVAPLEEFLDLVGLPNVALHSLQMGPNASDIKRIRADAFITDHISKFTDWADTAAFIDKLDLVISVDTAVAHLAGALGVEVWMLSQNMSCWRWWDIDIGETGLPWYETMHIIPQVDPSDWSDSIAVCRDWLIDKFEVQQAEAEAAQ